MGFWQGIKDTVAPFTSIASELRLLRELYELDLSSRSPAVIRITEAPKRTDTEVTYMDDPPKKKSAKDKFMESLEDDD